jgi:hypothetical protein
LTMLDFPTNRLCRSGAAMEYLSHNTSCWILEYSTPGCCGTKHLSLVRIPFASLRLAMTVAGPGVRLAI